MPRGDGSGPMGQGPMTGRAAGYCAGYNMPGYMNPIGARGFGVGFGRGRGGWGRRNMFFATGMPGWARTGGAPGWWNAPNVNYGVPQSQQMTREQELDMLKAQAEQFQGALEDIQNRITELEPASK